MYEQDQSLANWVQKQRKHHVNDDKERQLRQELLDEIGFVWNVDRIKKWHQQYEKLVDFKRKNGHCYVTQRSKGDENFGCWISRQRCLLIKKKLRPDRKELLDELGFIWKVDRIAARSSTMDDNVRGLAIGSFHDWVRSGQVRSGHSFFSLSFFLCLTCVCRIQIRKRSPPAVVWVFQTKQ